MKQIQITDHISLQAWVASKLAAHKTILDKSLEETRIIVRLSEITGRAKATIEKALRNKNKNTLGADNYRLIREAITRGEL